MDQETKPFSLQAPEQIAKEYGGNKQKIVEATQMGLVDPTAAVLAGMFIDRIRSAQAQEQVPQTTVAQQVLAPAPPPQQQMPPPSSPPVPMGLGATPQGAAMAPPQNQMAPPPQAGPTQAGLEALPVPDSDFADGGLVAFAGGGAYDRYKRAIIQQESGGRYGVPNGSGSGAMGIGQLMPDTARALAARLGMPYNPALLAGNDAESRAYQDALTEAATKEAWDYGKGDPTQAAGYYHAGPNKAGWGPKTEKYMKEVAARMGRDGGGESEGGGDGEGDDYYPGTAASPAQDRSLQMEKVLQMLGTDESDPARDALMAYYQSQTSPEQMKQDKERDKWEMLAQIGLGMASSKSPYLLQSFGEAASAALPGAVEARRARENKLPASLRGEADIAGQRRAEHKGDIKTALETTKDDRNYELAAAKLKQDEELSKAEIAAKIAMSQDDNTARIAAAKLNQPADVAMVNARYETIKMLRDSGDARYAGRSDPDLLQMAYATVFKWREDHESHGAQQGMGFPIVNSGQVPAAGAPQQSGGWGDPTRVN